MLKSWTVSNFKSIRERTEIKLEALTVFAGANSSGKSTLLQSILLASQTLASPLHSRSVVLNGKLLQLGSMSDLRSHGLGSESPTLIGFSHSREESDSNTGRFNTPNEYYEIDDDENIRTITCSFTFSRDADAASSDQRELRPVVVSSSLTATYRTDNGFTDSGMIAQRITGTAAARAQELELDWDSLSRRDRETLRYNVEAVEQSGNIISDRRQIYYPRDYFQGPPIGATLIHFLPSFIAYRYDMTYVLSAQLVDNILSVSSLDEPAEELVLSNSLSKRLVEVVRLAIEEMNRQGSLRYNPSRRERLEQAISEFERVPTYTKAREMITAGGAPIRDAISIHRTELITLTIGSKPSRYAIASLPVDVVRAVRAILIDKLRYLGPLRDAPRQFYPLEGAADPSDVGLRGEYTAAVLAANRETSVRYISSKDWIGDGVKSILTTALLEDAVVDWLAHFGVVTKIEAVDKGVFGHDMRVSVETNDTLHPLNHVGVGVSQVLPIVVMALLAPIGSVLIFEQPELHLHPYVQTRLADFLLSLASSGKQCLVETHSEYLINRLRLRAAEDPRDAVSALLALYYVVKKNGASSYERIHVNEYGNAPEWPDGFFDQSPREAERILEAAIRKREARRRSPRG